MPSDQVPSLQQKKPLLLPILLLISSALFLMYLWPNTQWDERVAEYYWNAQTHQFPLKEHVFLSSWMHDKLRIALWLMPLGTLYCLVKSIRHESWSVHSKQLVWLLTALVIAPLIVNFLKLHTTPICPWNMDTYGGPLAQPLFAFVSKAQAGVCFPAGHPAMGWGALAYYMYARHNHPSVARWVLLGVLLLGTLMAWVQIARGAHFVSHVLWALWVVCLVNVLWYQLFWPVAENNSKH